MSIASIVEQQIPSFIRDNSDVPFASFLDSYYRFLSESYTVTLDDLKYTSISLLQNENERRHGGNTNTNTNTTNSAQRNTMRSTAM